MVTWRRHHTVQKKRKNIPYRGNIKSVKNLVGESFIQGKLYSPKAILVTFPRLNIFNIKKTLYFNK